MGHIKEGRKERSHAITEETVEGTKEKERMMNEGRHKGRQEER
jgi:hypothetical protein